MSLLAALLVGTLAGLHIATWGMYKDAPHEGFHRMRYFRSVFVGAAVGALLHRSAGLDLGSASGLVLFFGVVYGCERVIVEIWKTFFRDEDQAKYTIPMQFRVLRTPVRSRLARAAVGALCLAVAGGIAWGLHVLQGVTLTVHPVVAVLAVGSVSGWLAAIGGAWKDAPIEGFSPLKFLRSPIMTMSVALLLAPFTDNWLILAAATLGYERAAVETYKTFFFPNRPRGKFAGKPILFPDMLERRAKFVYLFGGIWLVVAVTYASAWRQPSQGALGRQGVPFHVEPAGRGR